MTSMEWVFGVLWLAVGVVLVGGTLVSVTRPLWSRYIRLTPRPPKKGKKTPSPLGKALTNLMGTTFTLFSLSMGGLLIASAMSDSGAAGWFGVMALIMFGLVLLVGLVSGVLGSRLYLPAKPLPATTDIADEL